MLLMCCRQYEANEGNVSALRHATELCFAANSSTAYSLQDDVVLELFTKNIGTEVGAGICAVSWRHPARCKQRELDQGAEPVTLHICRC